MNVQSPAVRIRRLLYGQLLSRALCVVAASRVPDVLAAGPRTAEEVAAQVAANPRALRQMLRALSVFDVFVEHPDGTFGLTPVGRALCTDTWASALPTALLVGGEIGRAWNELDVTLHSGLPSFGAVFGLDFFSYADLKPELRATFDRSQERGLELDLDSITNTVDFGGYSTIVDVGGGDGALLAHLLTTWPHTRGVLMELPRVVPAANLRFSSGGLADRCEVVAGDFFEEVPTGGNLYLLRQILHDWDDEHCLTLLRATRRAMRPDATLMIVELVVDDELRADPDAEMTALMDLYMLAIFDGRERTRAEFAALLAAAGFAPHGVTPLSNRMAAITATPAAATPA